MEHHIDPVSCRKCPFTVCDKSIRPDFSQIENIIPNEIKIPNLPPFIPVIRRTETFSLIQDFSHLFPFFSVRGDHLMTDRFDNNPLIKSNHSKIMCDFLQDDLFLLSTEFNIIFMETVEYLKFRGLPLILTPEMLIEEMNYGGYGRAIWNKCFRLFMYAQKQIPSILMLPHDSDVNRVKDYVEKLIELNPSAIGLYLGKDGDLGVLKQNIPIVQNSLRNVPIIVGGIGEKRISKIKEFAQLGVSTFLVQSWEIEGSKKRFLDLDTEKYVKYDEKINCICTACNSTVEPHIRSNLDRTICTRHNLLTLRQLIEEEVKKYHGKEISSK